MTSWVCSHNYTVTH